MDTIELAGNQIYMGCWLLENLNMLFFYNDVIFFKKHVD